ncbi:MAG: SGNH/GDSL hydrolase family protein [Armatimonadetes bacterium]|nr:SGNH/GDSL hydrolase family protein [Armatimonadota bacterium]
MSEPVVREQYEWFNIWWDCANDPALPRVLLIGDSIACGYSAVVTRELQGTYHVDRLGTSRSLNDPVLLQTTEMMLREFPYRAVHFNNGLHGFHLDGPAYTAALREYVALIKRLEPDATLIWGNSTPITKNGEPQTLDPKNEVVTARNALAAEVMQAVGLPTDDLYAVVIDKPELRSPDGYHYNGEGNEVLGKAVAAALR